MWGRSRRQWRALGFRGGGGGSTASSIPAMVRCPPSSHSLAPGASMLRRAAALPRDRGNQSFYAVVFFALLFALILTFEVFFIGADDDDYAISPDFGEHELELLEPQREPPDAPAPDAPTTTTSTPTHTDGWQPVLGTREKFYVYAAYYDGRRGRFIRVVSATRTRGSDRVLCKYWYTNGDPPIIVGATNKVIRENWNLKYSAHFVLCPLFLYNVGRTVNVPDELSVLARPSDEPPGNRLKVRNSWPAHAAPQDSFAVCVKPLHYQFNRALQLIEFIELNRLLGVEHFTFYNHTVGRDVACILRQYEAERLVSLLPWQLDMESQKEIRTEGLFAALNDCLYRNMYRYRYVLMIDLDEFIVPHRNDSLRQMVTQLTARVDPTKVGSFSFMNAFFYLQWPNDSAAPVGGKGSPLVTLTKTRRRAKFHPHKQRSKCIVLPEYVIEMGNHFVWEFVPGHGTVNSPPDVGFLHHYRVCEFGGSDCVKTQWVTDRTMFKFKDEIVERVTQRLDSASKLCHVTV